ncbi:MAG TPA: hypothetical protein VKB05_08025 [Pyrinomonadaceae bacterium]|nr:hypothetical protein [Pyrinomonadaceae bacterium]
MPVNKKFKSSSSVSACRKPRAKAPGTRIGTLEDWRGVSGKLIKPNARNAFRDGR